MLSRRKESNQTQIYNVHFVIDNILSYLRVATRPNQVQMKGWITESKLTGLINVREKNMYH